MCNMLYCVDILLRVYCIHFIFKDLKCEQFAYRSVNCHHITHSMSAYLFPMSVVPCVLVSASLYFHSTSRRHECYSVLAFDSRLPVRIHTIHCVKRTSWYSEINHRQIE